MSNVVKPRHSVPTKLNDFTVIHTWTIPPFVTRRPGQDRGKGREEIKVAPGKNHTVVPGCYKGGDHHCDSQTYKHNSVAVITMQNLLRKNLNKTRNKMIIKILNYLCKSIRYRN